MNRIIVITALCAFLLGALFVFAFLGCSFRKPTMESFEDATDEGMLSPQEEELFNDIQKGDLNDQDIQKLVEDGKITEKMVEKFLTYLENTPEPKDGDGKVSTAKKGPVSPKKVEEEAFEVEPFTGNMFASYGRK